MAKGYGTKPLDGYGHPEDTAEAQRMIDAIRASGRSPNDALVLLIIGIITVFKNAQHQTGVTAEDFAKDVGETVLAGIRQDARLAAVRTTRQ